MITLESVVCHYIYVQQGLLDSSDDEDDVPLVNLLKKTKDKKQLLCKAILYYFILQHASEYKKKSVSM